MPKIVKVKLSSCGLEIADLRKLRLRNCAVAVAEQHFFKKLRKWFLQVAELRLRTQKKLRVSSSAEYIADIQASLFTVQSTPRSVEYASLL
jgi:hypothetical protein